MEPLDGGRVLCVRRFGQRFEMSRTVPIHVALGEQAQNDDLAFTLIEWR
jgi:hypothetical protein